MSYDMKDAPRKPFKPYVSRIVVVKLAARADTPEADYDLEVLSRNQTTWTVNSVSPELSAARMALKIKTLENLSLLKVEANVTTGELVLTCSGVSVEAVLRWKE